MAGKSLTKEDEIKKKIIFSMRNGFDLRSAAKLAGAMLTTVYNLRGQDKTFDLVLSCFENTGQGICAGHSDSRKLEVLPSPAQT